MEDVEFRTIVPFGQFSQVSVFRFKRIPTGHDKQSPVLVFTRFLGHSTELIVLQNVAPAAAVSVPGGHLRQKKPSSGIEFFTHGLQDVGDNVRFFFRLGIEPKGHGVQASPVPGRKRRLSQTAQTEFLAASPGGHGVHCETLFAPTGLIRPPGQG